MRFPVQVLVVIVVGFFIELFLPWWSVAIAAFTGGLLLNSRMNFLAGFLGVGVLWGIKALIADLSATSDLADRVARVFMLYSKALLIIITCVLGGLVGGFASMTGGALRSRNEK